MRLSAIPAKCLGLSTFGETEVRPLYGSVSCGKYETIRLRPDDVLALSDGLASWEPRVPAANLREAVQKVRKILLEASDNNLGVVFEPED